MRKKTEPKYTKDPKGKESFKEWLKRGIEWYNKLICVVRKHRNTTISKDMKVTLKDTHKTICGKGGSEEGGADEDNRDISEDESLGAYNGFAGEPLVDGIVTNQV